MRGAADMAEAGHLAGFVDPGGVAVAAGAAEHAEVLHARRRAPAIGAVLATGDLAVAGHLPGIVEDRGFTAQRNTQSAFTDGCRAFPLQDSFIVAANQRRAHSVGKDGMKKVLSRVIPNDNKAGIAMGSHFLHKIMDRGDIFLFNFIA